MRALVLELLGVDFPTLAESALRFIPDRRLYVQFMGLPQLPGSYHTNEIVIVLDMRTVFGGI